MSKYAVEFTAPAAKDIKKLDKVNKKRLLAKLRFYVDQEDPLGFAKSLRNRKDGNYRWRVGNYRIIFDIEGDKLIVLRVQHRREVYDK